MRVLLILGIALALVASGSGAAALAVNSGQWEAARLEAEALAGASASVEDARADALDARGRLADVTLEAEDIVAGVRAFLVPAPGWTTAASLIPLSKAVDSLAAELAHGVPLGVPVPDAGAASLDELAGRAEALTAIAHEGRDLTAVRRGLLADVGAQVESLARTAVATGGAAVDAMPLADGGLRATAHSALAGIATLLERQQDPLGGLVGYTSSWSAVSASQASAEAAAAAAAAAGAGGGGARSDRLLPRLDFGTPDFSKFPQNYPNGAYQPGCATGAVIDQFEAQDYDIVIMDFPFPYTFSWYLSPSGGYPFTVWECL